jgi:hypothetical protein
MGYNTNFEGKLNLSRQVTLNEFNKFEKIHQADHRNDKSKPDYYCQWEITKDGKHLRWDGSENFYSYVEWLHWLIENFFAPKDIKLSGVIYWAGENRSDSGKIEVENNIIKVGVGKKITFNELSYEDYINSDN